MIYFDIDFIKNILFSIFLITGILFSFVGLIGVYRFQNIYLRQHASGIIDTGGIFFICLALSIQSGFTLVSIKPLLLALIVTLTSAPTSYALMQILVRKESTKLDKKEGLTK